MSEQVSIELSEKAKAIIRSFQTMPAWALQTIARGMDKASALTLSSIQKDHLTGRGPFPPEQHKLGVRTGRLRSAAWFAPAEIRGQTATSAIGDNVKYAWVHEFGDTIWHPPRKGKVRLATDARGELLRQHATASLTPEQAARLAVFARKKSKRAKEVEFQAAGYEQVMPERAPFRTGVAENLDRTGRIVSNELVNAWKERN